MPLLFSTVLEVQVTAFRQQKEAKGIQIERGKVKISIFIDSIIQYGENPKELIKLLVELIIQQGQRIQFQYTKLYNYILAMNNPKIILTK